MLREVTLVSTIIIIGPSTADDEFNHGFDFTCRCPPGNKKCPISSLSFFALKARSLQLASVFICPPSKHNMGEGILEKVKGTAAPHFE